MSSARITARSPGGETLRTTLDTFASLFVIGAMEKAFIEGAVGRGEMVTVYRRHAPPILVEAAVEAAP